MFLAIRQSFYILIFKGKVLKKILFFFAGITSYVFICYMIFFFIYMIFKVKPFLVYGYQEFKTFYQIKEYINSQTIQKPRLLIVSGSNSIFSFDSKIIKENTPFYPVNFATNAGIPINFHIDKMIRNAKNGDYIFLPLEFEYYKKAEPKGEPQYIHDMLMWGDGYNKYISNVDIIKAYILAPFNGKAINLRRIGSQIKYNKPIDNIILEWQKYVKSGEKKFSGHSFKSLNAYGEYAYHEGEAEKIDREYLPDNIKISDFFISEYKRLESFAKQNDIKIFLTYPVTAENPKFSLQDPKTFAKIERLKSELAKHGIPIYGDFRDSHFEKKYFFDSSGYHLNSEGAKLRTQNFVKMLKEMEGSGIIKIEE